MADALIETMSSNPYDGIIADTATQISNIDAQIQQVSSAITNLEKASPTSPTLPKLRERLASLQSQKQWLTTTNESARSLSNSFNQTSENVNTLKWIYDIKQQELERAKSQDDAAYRKMYDDTQRQTNNYINALWNATSSENAIINANAGRDWASAQSTAEARARNYLNNAQAQNEAANTARQQLNAIEEWRINSWQWYIQLSQNNADNYLRQQVMNDFQAAEAEKDRQLQRWSSSYRWSSSGWWSSSRWTSSWWWWNWNWWGWWQPDIVDPYEEFSNPEQEWNWNWYPTLQEIIAEFDKQWTSPTYDSVRSRNPNITENEFLNWMSKNYAEYQNTLTSEKKNAITDSYNKWNMTLEEYWKQLVDLENQEKQEKKEQNQNSNRLSNIQAAEQMYLDNLRRFWPDSRYTKWALQYYNQLRWK